MTTLPLSSEFTGGTVTQADFKTAITDLRSYLAGLLGEDGVIQTAKGNLGIFGYAAVSKIGAYTVLATDNGKIFQCSGTWTLSLTAAATLGASFSCLVINHGTGNITINPYSSELIDGAATKVLTPGMFSIITCTGSSFRTASQRDPVDTSTLGVVEDDQGHDNIGSFCFARLPAQSTETLPGATKSGSVLTPCSAGATLQVAVGASTLSGTWRCLGSYAAAAGTGSLWQRIA